MIISAQYVILITIHWAPRNYRKLEYLLDVADFVIRPDWYVPHPFKWISGPAAGHPETTTKVDEWMDDASWQTPGRWRSISNWAVSSTTHYYLLHRLESNKPGGSRTQTVEIFTWQKAAFSIHTAANQEMQEKDMQKTPFYGRKSTSLFFLQVALL